MVTSDMLKTALAVCFDRLLSGMPLGIGNRESERSYEPASGTPYCFHIMVCRIGRKISGPALFHFLVSTRMKILVFVAALFTMSLLAGPVQAQTTGPTLIKKLVAQITAQPNFNIATSGDLVVVTDRTTGDEVFSLREVNSQTVTLSGRVGRLGERENLREHVAMFNFSSSVGTLNINESTGEVTIEHHLNPRHVTLPAMAQAASLFGQVARTQIQMFRQ